MVLFALEQAGAHFPEGRDVALPEAVAEGKQQRPEGQIGAHARCEQGFLADCN